jgi:3-oxoacyl-[acyl-carrier-protein] synthase-3
MPVLEEICAASAAGLTDIGLAGISYLSGPAESIDDWSARERLAPDVVRQLSQAGLRFVARQPDDARAALADCMSTAVAQAGLRPDDITAICFVPPSFEWSQGAEADLFEALAVSHFRRLPVVGVGLQGCGAIGAAIEVASGLALRRGAVLIVLSALPRQGASVDARSMRLFSCGVACAVLIPERGTFRILATATTCDVDVALGSFRGGETAAFQDSWQLLRAAVGELMAAADSKAGDIAFVCGSNVNEQALLAIAMAAGIPRGRVWAGGLAELGHLYSADALVSLARLERSGSLRPGDRILVVGWSEWVTSGMVLEYSP